MHYDTFPRIKRLQTVLLHSKHSRYEFHILRILPPQTLSNHVGDYIALNYTFMTHRVGNYQGAVVFYRDLTQKLSVTSYLNGFDITLPANNLRKNDIGLTGTMHYDIFPRITRLQTVLLHSIHCKHQFRILQYIIFVYTN